MIVSRLHDVIDIFFDIAMLEIISSTIVFALYLHVLKM